MWTIIICGKNEAYAQDISSCVFGFSVKNSLKDGAEIKIDLGVRPENFLLNTEDLLIIKFHAQELFRGCITFFSDLLVYASEICENKMYNETFELFYQAYDETALWNFTKNKTDICAITPASTLLSCDVFDKKLKQQGERQNKVIDIVVAYPHSVVEVQKIDTECVLYNGALAQSWPCKGETYHTGRYHVLNSHSEKIKHVLCDNKILYHYLVVEWIYLNLNYLYVIILVHFLFLHLVFYP